MLYLGTHNSDFHDGKIFLLLLIFISAKNVILLSLSTHCKNSSMCQIGLRADFTCHTKANANKIAPMVLTILKVPSSMIYNRIYFFK
jgi:hypothetical protein